MRINKLMIFGFGKFTQKEFEVAEDVTLFFGKNEAGKSTLRDFIVGMLFGMDEESDLYRQRKPWQGEQYGGRIELTRDKKSYIIERRFDENKKKVLMYDQETRKETEIFPGEKNRALYLNTLCVASGESSLNPELKSILLHHIAEKNRTLNMEFDVTKAIQYLRQQRAKISFQEQQNRMSEIQRRLGQIQEKEIEIEQLKQKNNLDKKQILDKSLTEISHYIGAKSDTIKEDERISFYRKVTLGGLGILSILGVVLQLYWFSLFCFIAVPALSGLYYFTDQFLEQEKLNGLDEDESKWKTTLFFLQKRREELQKQIYERTELEQEYERLKKEITLLQYRKNVLNSAEEKLRETAGEVHEQFLYLLNEEVSYIIEKITGGKYKEVKIDEKLRILVKEKDVFIREEHLGFATVEQIYLALRIATAKLLFGNKNMPILIDDIFGNFDSTRLSQTLDYLFSERQQIILFSCSSEVRAYFEEKKRRIQYIS